LGIGERLQSTHSLSGCQSTLGCKRNAVIQIECRDSIGHPFWNRDFCEAHANPVLEKALRLKIPLSWLQQRRYPSSHYLLLKFERYLGLERRRPFVNHATDQR